LTLVAALLLRSNTASEAPSPPEPLAAIPSVTKHGTAQPEPTAPPLAARAAVATSVSSILPPTTGSLVRSDPPVEAVSSVNVAAAPAPPAVEPLAAATPAPLAVLGRRRVSLAPLAAWSKPGLCSTSEGAEATREKLTTSFRRFDGEGRGQLHLDPRLPHGAEAAVLPLLAQAEAEVARQLGLHPEPPEVFVYLDQQLMKAAACINEEVVAFYDGALHLVADHSDLQASVTHELAHHALFGAGLIAPAWAQEGIAMLVAHETWWRAPERWQPLVSLPFSSEQMEQLIPYKLPSAQAVGFYVQAALTVQCLLAQRGWSLQQLTSALRVGSAHDAISYDLPELQHPSFVSDCLTTLRLR
jgi:hypothetical protein